MAIDFVAKYGALCKAGLPIDKVPEKYRQAVANELGERMEE